MGLFVSCMIELLAETLGAETTLEWLLQCVHAKVNLQLGICREHFATNRALFVLFPATLCVRNVLLLAVRRR